MAAPLEIQVQETDTLHNLRHGVPKCVTPHPNGKLYYVDIRAGEVHEYNPATGEHREFACIGPKDAASNIGDRKDREYVTAIGLNHDGSLIVARQSGVYLLNPDAQEGRQWLHLCDIPGVNDQVRPNNGTMVQCHDGKTRFFLGTATISGKPLEDGSKPGKLFVLETTSGGKFELQTLATGLVTANAVSGQVAEDATRITFADSHEAASEVKIGSYRPAARVLKVAPENLLDFKHGGEKATNGRPDGTSAVLFDNQPCIAIAAIDSNEIRVYALNDGHQVATLRLPKDVNKPTMATFHTTPEGTQCYISTLAPLVDGKASADERTGKIYSVSLPSQFKAIECAGSYPDYAALTAGEVLVSVRAGAMGRQNRPS